MPDRDLAIVVVAGGRGVRFGRPGGKQLAEAAGRPVLALTLEACLGVARAGLVVVVCDPGRLEEYTAALGPVQPADAEVRLVGGGERRQDSVAAGLAEVPPGAYAHIAVHDGARPLVQPATFDAALAVLDAHPDLGGVVVGHPSFDTLKVVEAGRIVETPDRSRYWVAQTPQVFREPVLRAAYERAAAEDREGTDDASLVERSGATVAMVEGPRDNIKVTVEGDLPLVEAVLRARGHGEGR